MENVKAAWITGGCAIVASIIGGAVGAYITIINTNPYPEINWKVSEDRPLFRVRNPDDEVNVLQNFHVCMKKVQPENAELTVDIFKPLVTEPESIEAKQKDPNEQSTCFSAESRNKLILRLNSGTFASGTVQRLRD